MQFLLAKYSALFALLLSLFLLTGMFTVATGSAEPAKSALCCNLAPAEHQAPASDAECSDNSCRCSSCQVSIPDFVEFPNQTPPAAPVPLALLTAATLSGYVRLIDYPPEFI